MQIEKNNRDIVREVEKINKTLEKNNKIETLNTNTKKLLKNGLVEYVNLYYENNKGDFFDNNLEECKKYFEIIENKNKIIKEIGKNQLEYDFLYDIFESVTSKAYKVYKKDFWARWDALSSEEKRRIYNINFEREAKKWRPIFEETERENQKTLKQIEKEKQREQNKNAFYLLINLILGKK